MSDIIEISSKITGVKKDKINADTKIAADLRIDGDDVVELLEEINKKYSLNFESFNFQKYFTPEYKINSIKSIYNYLFNKNVYEVTLKDIEEWIVNGYWKERDVGNQQL